MSNIGKSNDLVLATHMHEGLSYTWVKKPTMLYNMGFHWGLMTDTAQGITDPTNDEHNDTHNGYV